MIVVSYTLFTDAVKSKIVVARSVNSGGTWTRTSPLLRLGVLRNHGTSPAIDPLNGEVFVAWRLFYQKWPLMVMSRSILSGSSVPSRNPDLGTVAGALARPNRRAAQGREAATVRSVRRSSRRRNTRGRPHERSPSRISWPASSAVGRACTRPGRSGPGDVNPLPASPAFGFPSWNGSPRVMFTMSTNGGWTWNARRAIDAGPRTEHPTLPGLATPAEVRLSGPQVQPFLNMSGITNPQLFLTYYEARSELAEPFGWNFISGIERQMDVRSARINPLTGRLVAPSIQVAQYPVKANSSPVELNEPSGATTP